MTAGVIRSRIALAQGVLGIVVMLALAWGPSARAEQALADPDLEARAQSLFHELRCVVCQNQSIASSQAQLAADMRLLVRSRLAAGEDEAAIRAYLVGRYGDYVLLDPPLGADTLILWFAPFFVLGLAGLGLWRFLRTQGVQAASGTQALSAEEERQLAAVLTQQSDSHPHQEKLRGREPQR